MVESPQSQHSILRVGFDYASSPTPTTDDNLTAREDHLPAEFDINSHTKSSPVQERTNMQWPRPESLPGGKVLEASTIPPSAWVIVAKSTDGFEHEGKTSSPRRLPKTASRKRKADEPQVIDDTDDDEYQEPKMKKRRSLTSSTSRKQNGQADKETTRILRGDVGSEGELEHLLATSKHLKQDSPIEGGDRTPVVSGGKGQACVLEKPRKLASSFHIDEYKDSYTREELMDIRTHFNTMLIGERDDAKMLKERLADIEKECEDRVQAVEDERDEAVAKITQLTMSNAALAKNQDDYNKRMMSFVQGWKQSEIKRKVREATMASEAQHDSEMRKLQKTHDSYVKLQTKSLQDARKRVDKFQQEAREAKENLKLKTKEAKDEFAKYKKENKPATSATVKELDHEVRSKNIEIHRLQDDAEEYEAKVQFLRDERDHWISRYRNEIGPANALKLEYDKVKMRYQTVLQDIKDQQDQYQVKIGTMSDRFKLQRDIAEEAERQAIAKQRLVWNLTNVNDKHIQAAQQLKSTCERLQRENDDLSSTVSSLQAEMQLLQEDARSNSQVPKDADAGGVAQATASTSSGSPIREPSHGEAADKTVEMDMADPTTNDHACMACEKEEDISTVVDTAEFSAGSGFQELLSTPIKNDPDHDHAAKSAPKLSSEEEDPTSPAKPDSLFGESGPVLQEDLTAQTDAASLSGAKGLDEASLEQAVQQIYDCEVESALVELDSVFGPGRGPVQRATDAQDTPKPTDDNEAKDQIAKNDSPMTANDFDGTMEQQEREDGGPTAAVRGESNISATVSAPEPIITEE